MWSTNSSCEGLCCSLSPSAGALPVCRPAFGATSGPRTGLSPPPYPLPSPPGSPLLPPKPAPPRLGRPGPRWPPGTCPLHIGGLRAGGLRAHPRRAGQRSPAGLPSPRGNGESGLPAMPEGRAAVRLGPGEQPGGAAGAGTMPPPPPGPSRRCRPCPGPARTQGAFSGFSAPVTKRGHCARSYATDRGGSKQVQNIQMVLTPRSAGG